MASSIYCGTGVWGSLPKPGDPSFNSVLSAKAAFGGIDVWWSYPDSNPHAVAHTRLYRSLSGTDEYPVLHTIVNGNFFYDKIEGTRNIEYFYWIQFVSINGTEGEMIGPVSAVANPPIADVIAGLTGAIDQGHLAQSLKTEVGKILNLEDRLDIEVNERMQDITSLGSFLEDVQFHADATRQLLMEEAEDREIADAAFVNTVNQMELDFNGAMAAQKTEITSAYQNHVATALTSYQTAVDAESARAALAQGLRSEWQDEVAVALTEYYTSAETDAALASQKTLLKTEFDKGIATALQDYETAVDAQAARSSLQTTIGAERDNAIALALQDYETAVDAESARSSLGSALQAKLDNTNAAIASEATARSDGDSALSGRIDVLNSTMTTVESELSAAIQTEQQARVDADEAIARQVTTVQSEVNDDIASVEQRMETRLKNAGTWANSFEAGEEFDSWVAQAGSIEPETDEVWGGDQAALVRGGGSSPSSSGTTGAVRAAIPASRTILYSRRRIRISFRAKRLVTTASNEFALTYSTNADGNSGWHRFNPTTEWEQYSFLYDVPYLSGQRDHYIGIWGDTSGGNGGVWIDAMFITLVANEEDLPGFGAMYTAKVDVNGLIGGFGIYNDGDVVDAGFDVDRFWVGRTSSDKVKPFIIANDQTYIDEAVINKLTFDKLRAADASVIVENGKLKAEYVQANQLEVEWGKIKNVSIKNADIGNAAVDTLQINGNAVTVPESISTSGEKRIGTGWTHVLSLYAVGDISTAVVSFSAIVRCTLADARTNGVQASLGYNGNVNNAYWEAPVFVNNGNWWTLVSYSFIKNIGSANRLDLYLRHSNGNNRIDVFGRNITVLGVKR